MDIDLSLVDSSIPVVVRSADPRHVPRETFVRNLRLDRVLERDREEHVKATS